MENQEMVQMVISTELLCALYMGGLLVVLGLIPFLAKLLQNDFISFYKHRESVKLEGWGIRAEKSVKNLYESLPLFIVLVFVVEMLSINSETTAMGVWVFCISRTIHPISYILNIPPVRTLAYFGGLIGMGIIGFALF